MNIRVIWTGVMAGILVTLMLFVPLYLVLPAAYVPSWSTASSLLVPSMYVLTILTIITCGYASARWGWASSVREGGQMGAVAGVVAGLVVCLLLASGAGGVIGISELLMRGNRPAGSEAEMVALLADAVTSVVWASYLMIWGVPFVSALLGSLGGIWSSRMCPAGWGREPRPMHPLVGRIAAMLLLFASSIGIVVAVGLSAVLSRRMQEQMQTFAVATVLPVHGVALLPLGSTLALLLVAVSLSWRWIGARWHDDNPGTRQRARLGAMLTLSLPIIALTLAVMSGISVAALLACFGLMSVAAMTARGSRALRKNTDMVVESSEVGHLTVHDWLDCFMVAWFVLAAACLLVAVVPLTVIQGVIPFVGVLSGYEHPFITINIKALIESIYTVYPTRGIPAITALAVLVMPVVWLAVRSYGGRSPRGEQHVAPA